MPPLPNHGEIKRHVAWGGRANLRISATCPERAIRSMRLAIFHAPVMPPSNDTATKPAIAATIARISTKKKRATPFLFCFTSLYLRSLSSLTKKILRLNP